VTGLLLPALTGCKVFCLAARTLVCEPIHFCNPIDQCRSHKQHYALAIRSWKVIECQQPDMFSTDYERGYKDGFADYLDYGGNGTPPPIPPREYWKIGYRTPAGHQAIQDWFDGFRHGSAEAQASGLRDYATVPSSIPAPCELPAALSWPTERQPEQIQTPAPVMELPPVLQNDVLPSPPYPALSN
jgi:hypothetical protein